MTDLDKLESLVSDSRLIAASDHLIFPMIKLRIERRIALACGKFLSGERDFALDIAYIQGLREIEQELKSLQRSGNQAIADQNNKN